MSDVKALREQLVEADRQRQIANDAESARAARPGRPLWWVEIRWRLHRDTNHRAEYLDWKANR